MKQQRRVNVLYMSLRWPQPSATAAGSRTLHIIDAIRRIISSEEHDQKGAELRLAFATPQRSASAHSREALAIFAKNNESHNKVKLV